MRRLPARSATSGGGARYVAGAGGVSVVATGTVACVSTLAGVSDTLDLRNSGTVFSAGHDSITTAGTVWVAATGQDTIHAGAGRTDLTGRPGGASTVVGGAGGFIYAGQGGALDYTGGSGTALITAGTGAATIRFGTGATTLTLGTGAAQLIFTHGQTSSDTIQGFDPTRDTITYQGFTGSAVASQTTSAGTTWTTRTRPRCGRTSSGSAITCSPASRRIGALARWRCSAAPATSCSRPWAALDMTTARSELSSW